jgi:phosphate starvation-inducible PhoH-like protein
MSNNAKRLTRKQKTGEQPVVEVVAGEAVVPVQQKQLTIKHANPRQKTLLQYLQEGRQVVFAIGSAGTGKSFLAAYHGSELLRTKKIDKIFLVRANVSTGKSNGALPGTLEEKLLPFFKQTLEHLGKFMGKGFLGYCLTSKKVEMLSVEHIRGMSIENALVIVEESQNLTSDELEAILTRIGDGCQLVLTGDQKQNDLKGKSGLMETIAMIDDVTGSMPDYLSDEDLQCMAQNIGIVTFTPDDVVRSGLCRAFVKMYYHN